MLSMGVAEMNTPGSQGGDCRLGLGVRHPAGKGLSHLASRAGAIRPPNYEIIEVLR